MNSSQLLKPPTRPEFNDMYMTISKVHICFSLVPDLVQFVLDVVHHQSDELLLGFGKLGRVGKNLIDLGAPVFYDAKLFVNVLL